MEDFLGNKYGVGDYVVYAVSNSSTVRMVYAEVVEVRDNGNLRVQPLKDSRRWSRDTRRYRDTRTGAESRYASDFPGSLVETSHYITPDGQKFYNYWRALNEGVLSKDLKYVPPKFADWLEVIEVPAKLVTISVTENVVKVG